MNTSLLQNKKVLFGASLVIAVLIVAVAWVMFIGPKLSSASSLRSQAQSVELQTDVLRSQNTQLKRESQNLAALRTSLSGALAELPSDTGLPTFTNQLAAQAAANHVTLTSITIGASTAAGSTTTTTTTSSTSGTAASSAPSTGGLTQTQVTIVTSGTLTDQLAFLKAVETNGPRTALVTSTQFSVNSGGRVSSVDGGASATTQLTIFSSPRSSQQSAELQKLLNG